MSGVDLSIVLNLHREGKYLLRTLRSLKEASDYARSEGLKIELIAVLDRADAFTRSILAEFDASSFDGFCTLEVDFGSLGPSRNAGVAACSGEYILLCDGDDLVSFNYISASFHTAHRHGRYTVVVPQWMFEFDANYCIVEYGSLTEISPAAFLDVHPYVSKILVHRDIFSKNTFADVRLSAGFAYEDWHFNANAVALGYSFEVAPDAIIFYRIRHGSLLRQANHLSVRQIPPSRLFEPETYLEVCAQAAAHGRDVEFTPQFRGKAILENPVYQHLVAAANRIDPKIDLDRLRRGGEFFAVTATDLAPGKAYADLCASLIDQRFAHVFLFPHFGVGGAERYFVNLLAALESARADEPILVLLGEAHPDNAWLSKLSDRVRVLDLATYLPALGNDGVNLLALKVVQHTAPNATIHVRQCYFGETFLQKYGRALEEHRIICYYFCEDSRPISGFSFAHPWSFSFVEENIDYIDTVVADNAFICRTDQARLGVPPQKWRVLPTLMNPALPAEEALARTHVAGDRILWASRMSWQKRPSLLRPIAEVLGRLRPELSIDVHGIGTEDFDPAVLSGLPNVRYWGAYSDFSAIVKPEHFVFAYTSLFDGIPTVLLEAASAGLPVIAPDVPAIDEFIVNEETGLLLASLIDDEAMAEAYARAIIRLSDDPSLQRRLVAEAHAKVIAGHSTAPYTKALQTILEGQ